jgi:hypothetical protein
MFCRPKVLCLLNFITENTQVTEGRQYFPRGLHIALLSQVGQPCIILWTNNVRDQVSTLLTRR